MQPIAPGRSLRFLMTLCLTVVSGGLPLLAVAAGPPDDHPPASKGVAHHVLAAPATDSSESVRFIQPDGSRQPKLIIGPDSRVQVTDTTVDPYKKIVHLIATDEDEGVAFRCTGSFIGPKVVMTSAHCVWTPSLGGWADTVEVIPARNADQIPFGSEFADTASVPTEWIESLSDGNNIPDWSQDYALLVMEDSSLGATVGSMTIGVLGDEELNDPSFNPTTAGYPGDKQEGTMWLGSDTAFTEVLDDHLVHVIDSWAGQSGSPLWRGSDELIVGIESLEGEIDNVALRITQDVVDGLEQMCEEEGCTFNLAQEGGNSQPPVARPSDPAFQSTWQRTDRPVAEAQAVRSWIWGPQPNTQVVWETYDQAPGGQRAVQYYDKSRMEITNPDGDPNSIWFVTNGLLATELISGQMQAGDNAFQSRSPAAINVAGDANDPDGPTYASFTGLLGATGQPVGTPVTQRVNRAGIVVDEIALADQGVTIGYLDEITNHGIAGPFWDFMNSSGTVYENGAFVNAPLFENAFFATGRPITEPYWATVLVGGTPRLVLMQCFERRCLTYTPDNAPEWRVEMGNIGLHYYAWRYEGSSGPPPGTSTLDLCLDAAEYEFLTLLIDHREQNSLSPLANSAALNIASYNHSLDMGTRGYLDHTSPEGISQTDRARSAGYEGAVAENIAGQHETAQAVFDQWRNSASNNANMLAENAVVGIGRVYVQGSDYGWYWTVKFGDISSPAPTTCG